MVRGRGGKGLPKCWLSDQTTQNMEGNTQS